MSPRRSERALLSILESLRENAIKFRIVDEISPADAEWGDFVLTLGNDNDILKTFHKIFKLNIPILGVNENEDEKFLTEIGLSKLRQVIHQISKGKFDVEESKTLAVKTDTKEFPPAVNEVAIFPHRSATLLEYTLKVDDEEIWTDSSDGLIIATPTGSTAYAMSAGGPMILPKANVFTIVSVNSLDITRRPLIIPEDSKVKIDNIVSRLQCEIIVDGVYRSKIGRIVEVSKSINPARLIRLAKTSHTANKMAKKIILARDLLTMPPSAKLMLKILEYEGPLSRRDILKKTMLPDRTVSLALSILLDRGLVKRRSSLRDGREKMYSPV
ncbi:MAG TPA: sugar kinase [Nitrososphaerales archaeon]|jgi:NAD+ kinase|nr:sugar kinase [Nitrososphaerales archaeon]|tara:strand:- start:3672 stop:4655 length:984 start_codon:yes stop_codon:yes gene_type:complete